MVLSAGTSRATVLRKRINSRCRGALHAAADDLAFEDIQGGEHGGGAVALVIVGHGGATSFLHRQTGLGAIEGLDLALLVEAEHHSVGGWIDIEADHLFELLGEFGIVGELERAHPVGLQPVPLPDAPHRGGADPHRLGAGINAAHPLGAPHFTETTARPLAPHPRHQTRDLQRWFARSLFVERAPQSLGEKSRGYRNATEANANEVIASQIPAQSPSDRSNVAIKDARVSAR